MKFLICGIGSMGQRHYKNLQALGHEVAIARSKNSTGYNSGFINRFFTDEDDAGRKTTTYSDIVDGLNQFHPDGVFICTPNHAHIEPAMIAARHKKHIFIEKPLSHNLDSVYRLHILCREYKLVTMIGYNFRFEPSLQSIFHEYQKEYIERVFSAHALVSENIQDWHPWEDYKKSYGPWRDQGGGVVLCFSHEIDYLYWFFGKPITIRAIGGKMTSLEGDAEDIVKILFEFEGGKIVSLHMDYWGYPTTREFYIVGNMGSLHWRNNPPYVDRNQMYISEIKEFISAIEEKRESLIPLSQGRDVLEICLEIKKQIEA